MTYTLKHSNKVIILLMSLGVFCFSIWGAKAGLVPCLLGGILFFKSYSLSIKQIIKDCYPIRWWIFANLGIIFMSFISLFFCFDILKTSIAILNFLLIPLIVFLVFFLVFKYIPQQDQNMGLKLISAIFILHSLFTIGECFIYGNPRSVGIGNHPIIPYTLFLLIPFALSLSLLVYSRFKILAIILMATSLIALYANGTRASILSVGAMLFGLIFYPQYKYKRIIATLAPLLLGVCIGLLIEWSAHQNARLNFKRMIENIGIVWNYAPAEMGRFDSKCFIDPSYRCRAESGTLPDPRFSFESNALQRLSLNKSAICIIQNNPLLPHGYYSRYWNSNLPLTLSSKQHSYLINSEHNHIHNEILSSFFELGIIGGCLYLSTFFLLLVWSIKQKGFYRFLLFSITLGTFVMSFFDSMLSLGSIKILFYSLIGILFGINK